MWTKSKLLTIRGCVTEKHTKKHTKKPRAIANFSETLGAIPLKFAGYVEDIHIYK